MSLAGPDVTSIKMQEQQKAKKEEAAREREAEAAAAQEREAAKQAAKEKGGSAKKQVRWRDTKFRFRQAIYTCSARTHSLLMR